MKSSPYNSLRRTIKLLKSFKETTYVSTLARAYTLIAKQIDVVPEGSVIFLSQPVPHINAVYGGLMSLRAKFLGAQGVIIDGRVRDVQEHRELGFPVSNNPIFLLDFELTSSGFRQGHWDDSRRCSMFSVRNPGAHSFQLS